MIDNRKLFACQRFMVPPVPSPSVCISFTFAFVSSAMTRSERYANQSLALIFTLSMLGPFLMLPVSALERRGYLRGCTTRFSRWIVLPVTRWVARY